MRISLGTNANVTPLPVLIIATYNEDGTPNAMNAAWGTQFDRDVISIYLSSHKTTDNLKARKAFTVSFATAKTMKESDYFGIESGRKTNKIIVANFSAYKSEYVDAPIIPQYPLTLECEVMELREDGEDAYTLFGKVKNVSADESILTNGKVDMDKLEAIAFCPFDNTYRLIGKKVGNALRSGLLIKNKKK